LINFSTSRARQHINIIARKTHPLGSADNLEVCNYIIKEITAYGLTPESQRAVAVNTWRGAPFSAGTIENILVRIKGTNNTKAVLVTGHYDSVPTSSGASDDGVAVAIMLETLRMLKEEPPLKNDVIFLFTDGEEAGLLGARAFVNEHQWTKDVGVALNFEARGNRGPSVMFETSSENGWLVAEFAKAAPHPITSSVWYELFKLTPNDTDLTVFKRAGHAGLNFAYIDGLMHYHTQLDSPDHVSERSIQHHGSYALTLTRHFGSLDLHRVKANDVIYFDILGATVISYPAKLALTLAIIAHLLFVSMLLVGIKRKYLILTKVVSGALVFLVSIIAPIMAVSALWRLMRMLNSEYKSLPNGDIYNNGIYLIGYIAITIAIVSSLLLCVLKKLGANNLAAGALLWWAVLAVLVAIYFKGGSYILAWPLLFSTIGLGMSFLLVNQNLLSWKRRMIFVFISLPAILLLTPLIYLGYITLSVGFAEPVIIIIVLLLGLLIPHIDFISTNYKWVLPAASLSLGLCLIIVGGIMFSYDSEHPKANHVLYGLDADTNRAIWASADSNVDEWTSQFFTGDVGKRELSEFIALGSRMYLTSPAPLMPLVHPQVSLLSDITADSVRAIHLRISSPRHAPVISVYVNKDVEIIKATVNGKPVNYYPQAGKNAATQWAIRYHDSRREGIDLSLDVRPMRPLNMRVVDHSYGLSDLSNLFIKPRPGNMIPSAQLYSDSVLVSKSFTF